MFVVFLYCLGFSLFDYVGYNAAVRNDLLPEYRVVQSLVQVGITYKLTQDYTWREAVAFNILWWTWVADWMYYGWAYVFNRKSCDNRCNINQRLNHVTWAWWTPYGLATGGRTHRPLPVNVLVAQSFIGVTFSFVICEAR